MRFAFKKNDFDLVKFLKRNCRISVIAGPEAIKYLSSNLDFFFEDFRDFETFAISAAKAMFTIDFEQNEAEWFFNGHQKEAVQTLNALCSRITSSYLLQPEIKEKVLKKFIPF